jgi:hypothetical protein
MRKLRLILPEAVITAGQAFSRSAPFHRRAFRHRDWNDSASRSPGIEYTAMTARTARPPVRKGADPATGGSHRLPTGRLSPRLER